MKNYTLKEAFDKRLLFDGDYVDVSCLYKPYKRILSKENVYSSTISFSCLTLEDFLGKEFGKNERLGKARIYKKEGSIYVISEWPISLYIGDERRKLIASKFLTISDFNIEAEYKMSYKHFVINMGPDIVVEFDSKDDFPILKLPMHTVYTC